MARKKREPRGSWGFIKDLVSTPVVVPSTPVVVPGTLSVGPPGLDEAPGLVDPPGLIDSPGLDPPFTEEERELVKQLTGRPQVRFVWD